MNLYNLLLILTAASYGGLTALVGIIQLKQRKINLASSLIMIAGGLLLLFSLMLKLSLSRTLLISVSGLLLIQSAAISNGLHMFGRVNPKHHILRLGISIIIVVLFLYR